MRQIFLLSFAAGTLLFYGCAHDGPGVGGSGLAGQEVCPGLRSGEHQLSYDKVPAESVLQDFQGILGCEIRVGADARPALDRATLTFSSRKPLNGQQARELLDLQLQQEQLVLRTGPGYLRLDHEPMP